MEESTLNPMFFYTAFQHITEQIFVKLDDQSLKNCRTVAKSWQKCIDNRNILLTVIVEKNGGNKTLQLACQKFNTKIVQILIQKPADFDIDWKARDDDSQFCT